LSDEVKNIFVILFLSHFLRYILANIFFRYPATNITDSIIILSVITEQVGKKRDMFVLFHFSVSW